MVTFVGWGKIVDGGQMPTAVNLWVIIIYSQSDIHRTVHKQKGSGWKWGMNQNIP